MPWIEAPDASNQSRCVARAEARVGAHAGPDRQARGQVAEVVESVIESLGSRSRRAAPRGRRPPRPGRIRMAHHTRGGSVAVAGPNRDRTGFKIQSLVCMTTVRRYVAIVAFPLATDAGEAEGAELELVAESSEDRRLGGSEGAGQVIRPLALGLEVEQVVGARRSAWSLGRASG